MPWSPTLYSFLGGGAAVISIAIAVTAYRYRGDPGAQPFVALMIALAGWSLAYAVQLGFTTMPAQLLWQQVSLAIGGTVPTLWLLFTIEYAGKSDWLTRGRRALLAVDPIAFGLLTLTNPLHGLIWQQATFTPGSPPPVVTLSLGVGYYVHIIYAYVVVAGGLGLLILVFTRSSSLYRKQSSTLIFGALPPFLANIAFTLRIGWGPLPALDLTPFAFVLTGLLFSLAHFQFDLLDRAPIARQRILNEMGDGVIVLDTDATIVEANPIARRILDPPPTVGTDIREVIPTDAETNEAALAAIRGRTITTTIGGQRRAYDIQVSSLTDHHDRRMGHVIALRDVTTRNAHEQRLEVTQRILRHNLRNDMNVVRGWAERLTHTETDGADEPAHRIIDTADELIDLAEKTRRMVGITEYASEPARDVDVSESLHGIVEEFREQQGTVTIETDIPTSLRMALPDEELVVFAVRNLLENAIEHNDADDPWVEVSIEQTATSIDIRIADNGPGIPPFEREVLKGESETPLKHGSGVGLWLAYWCTTTAGGEIDFANRKPRGSVVTLRFPHPDDVPAEVDTTQIVESIRDDGESETAM